MNGAPQLPPLTDAMYHAVRGNEYEFSAGGPECVTGYFTDDMLDEIWEQINTTLRVQHNDFLLRDGVLMSGRPPYYGPGVSPMSKWPFEQPHVACDLLARLYVTMGRVRDAMLEAEIDVFLAATRRP